MRTFDDPILKTVCHPLERGEDLTFLRSMRVECEAHNGVGLAAPQIGHAKRAVYIAPKNGERLFMLNPVVTDHSKITATDTEGCLSYPGVYVPIERFLSVRVRYFDESWREHERTFVYFGARVIQHELDHLDGICRVGDHWRKNRGAAAPMLPLVAAVALMAGK